MLSAFNHVRGLTGESSVRTAQLLSCPSRKEGISRGSQLCKGISGSRPLRIPRSFRFHASSGPSPEPEYKPTPSEYLTKNLKNTNHALGLELGERPLGALDLSHINIKKPHSKEELRKTRRPRKTYGRPQRQSLQTTLGEYIRLVDPFLSHNAPVARTEVEDLEHALSIVFRPESCRFLTERGYDVEDVVAWAWIFRKPCQAILRMFALEADSRSRQNDTTAGLPVFIPMFLLRKRHLDARSFRLLLIYCLHLMSGQPLPSLAAQEHALELTDETSIQSNPNVRLDSATCMTMTVRLVRHARQVWPQSLPTIASAFSRYFKNLPTHCATDLAMKKRIADGLKTEKFNDCLWLFSLPTKLHPFQSTYFQEQAQFELLRAMASHDPVLPVTRKGYRAMIAVQLAHRKTWAERQSAELKAPSWPPWKEERLGLDADRGNEGMYSRAQNVLSQMKDAGYSHQVWEMVASVLAGWDTDHSPTVQTRKLLPRPKSSLCARDSDPDHYAVWTARIRATRTVREAWACFLSYQDKGLPTRKAVYFAMAERLIYRAKAVEAGFDHASNALPGDGLEVHHEPTSARDVIYVRTEPPTWEAFVDDMISQGIRPSGRFLALLLQSTRSFRSGLHYLRASDLTEDQITALCTIWYHPPSTASAARYFEALRTLPDHIFASFIKFLCSPSIVRFRQLHGYYLQSHRFPMLLRTRSPGTPLDDLSQLEEEDGQTSDPKSMWHGVQLAKLRKPVCHEAWSHILTTIETRRGKRNYSGRRRSLYYIVEWQEALKVIKWMKAHDVERGVKGFSVLCTAFHRAITAASRWDGLVEEASQLIHSVNHPHTPIEPDGHDKVDDFVESGVRLLKSEFDYLVNPTSKTSNLAEQSIFTWDSTTNGTAIKLPALLHVPPYATLHRYVRVLGLVGDNEGILELLQWMSRSAGSLNELAEEQLNGHKMMRQTLVAVRISLEKLQTPQKGQRLASTRTTDPQVQKARDLIRRIPEWEWPNDEEVEEYLLFKG